MRKIYILITTAFFVLLSFQILAQETILQGVEARNFIEGTEMIRISERSEVPSYIRFSENSKPDIEIFELILTKKFKISNELKFVKIKSTIDPVSGVVDKYIQTYNDVPLHDATFKVMHKNGKVSSISGIIYSSIEVNDNYSISNEDIVKIAIDNYPSDLYKWEIPGEELLLKDIQNNQEATYYPSAQKVLFPVDYPRYSGAYSNCYKLTIYSDKPLFKKTIILNASSGKVEFEFNDLHFTDVLASAETKYSGNQEITTDSYNGSYRLRETGRGNGIETYDMNTGTSYSNSVDFTDTDNIWNNFNSDLDEVATDAHWGAEMTYDYFLAKHQRNSIDGNGFKLKSYVHYDFQYDNAFWDGTRMTYGDGSNGNPFVGCDIVGHEISHGLTSYTANLDYAYESGALNEGFSDIFGTSIEFFAKPNDANWTIGEDIGFAFRSMSNPNQYSYPDTYYGNYWYSGTGDNGGVHYNSSVINHWYYLLCVGGVGTNDLGNSYNVSGIGLDDAGKIAFRTLTTYLTNTSQYADARFFSIMAAIDLYGGCSTEVEAVTRAWYAVGIGPNYVNTVLSDFSADFLEFCETPATVHFTNNSVNGTSYIWDFGDGTTTSTLNPSHIYTSYGNFTVSLYADGGTCGEDTLIQTSYISVDPANPCITVMSDGSTNNTQTSCTGYLYDSGGQSNYQNDVNSIITINPAGALNVTLTFTEFNFELNYDYLYIYDGPNTNSTLIGQYTGSSLPNLGMVQSTGSSLTIRQSTDPALVESGFAASWQCQYANTAPVTQFYAYTTETCDGDVQFHDNSFNGATEWLWEFGDGNTSILQHPSHIYAADGLYSVKLVSSNAYGIDSTTYSDYITVSSPQLPVGVDGVNCGPGTVNLEASGTGKLVWYDQEVGGDIIGFDEYLVTPNISSSEQYWVGSYSKQEFDIVGKTDNSGGGGNFGSAFVHYLVFDCYTEIKLVSVKVYSTSAGNRLIRLNDASGNMIDQRLVDIPQGESRITLDFTVPPGADYQLAGPESPDLYRNNAGTNYPYNLYGIASVKYSSASTDPTGYYYYFYEWEVMETQCTSERVPVMANILDLPVADFSFINSNGYVTFSNSSVQSNEYVWDFGDGTTSTSENPVHAYSASGTYQVSLITTNDCGSDTITYDVVITTTDINEVNSNFDFNIYPNPVNTVLNIEFDNRSDVSGIELYDILGNILWSDKIIGESDDYKGSIDMSQISKGVYFMRINLKDSFISKKIILQ